MIKNYLSIAFRNLFRNKVFSFINVLGLALGMSCSLLIFLWVYDERSVDNFHANDKQLFAMYERQYYDGKIVAGYYTPGQLADEMKKVIPEVKYSTGFAWDEIATLEIGGKINKETGNHAGADFFKMFSYKLLQGNPENALKSPNSIAISRKMAENYFGSPQAAMGKTIRYENREDFIVSAVFENIASQSSVKFDFIRNWQAFMKDQPWTKDWGSNGPSTFIQLRADADPVKVEARMKKFLDGYNKEQSASFRIELGMQRFGDIYLNSSFENGKPNGGRIEYVRLFSMVAVFILLIACINFMNLATARSVKRAKEVGIRKVVGAVRSGLIGQFIGEAVMLAFISVLFAFLILILVLPSFNNLTGKQILLPVSNPFFWLILIALTILTGLVAGSYPSFFLSTLNPVKILKGSLKFGSGANYFRKGLVVFQFVLSIILITGTMIISNQTNYCQTMNLGYERENLIYVPLEGDLTKNYTVFKQEISKLPGIKDVSRISQSPTRIQNSTSGVDWTGKSPTVSIAFTQASVGYDFVKTMDLKIVQGRDFSKEFATDSVSYLINEEALKRIGYKDPIGQSLTFWGKKGKIVGVVKNFHFNSLHEQIQPFIMRLRENEDFGSALVRTTPGKTKEAIASLEKISHQLNPKFPFTYYFSDEEYQKLYKNEEVVTKLSNSFAILAIFISCLGLLGLAMFAAEQRIKEIGIRKVMGASVTNIVTMLSKDFVILVSIAFVIATPIAWYTMHKWLQNFAYQTQISWWTFAFAGILALFIALITVSFQAIKAALANPVKSLRTE